MKTTGLIEYRSAMALASVRVGAGAAMVTRKTATAINRDAKILAPVDTGNLRSSLGVTLTGDGRAGTMRAEISPTASYAVHVEYGTSRMAAQPFLWPATERHVPAWMAALEQIAAGGLK